MGRFATLTSLALVLAVLSFAGDKYTRGVGIYPGNPDEDFAPVMVSDATNYRNIALLRPVDSVEDSVVAPIALEFPAGLSPLHFLRLKLVRGDATVSENFYWRPVQEGNYQALKTVPKVKVEDATRVERQGQRWILTTELKNPSAQPALMVQLKAVREKSGDRILPALFTDNFVSLMPGEQKSIQIQIEDADTRGEKPRIVLEGFNVSK
jgi:hypothetical protein